MESKVWLTQYKAIDREEDILNTNLLRMAHSVRSTKSTLPFAEVLQYLHESEENQVDDSSYKGHIIQQDRWCGKRYPVNRLL